MSAYIQFGSGKLFLNPNAGNLAVNPTPLKALTIQDVSIDISGDIKELKGASQFPDDVAVGDKKGTGKFSIGRKDLSMFNQIFFADISAAGGVSVSPDEAHSIPATTPFTITMAPPDTSVFANDLGVNYAGTGKAFTKVASGPTVGQYSVVIATGVYTFAAADEGVAVTISYSFTLSAAGATYQVNNQVLGWGPQVEMFLVDTYQPVSGIFSVIHLYAAKVSKVSIGNKRVDYSMPEVDFSYFQSASGRVIDLYSNVG
jgi:hypothetical protein